MRLANNVLRTLANNKVINKGCSSSIYTMFVKSYWVLNNILKTEINFLRVINCFRRFRCNAPIMFPLCHHNQEKKIKHKKLDILNIQRTSEGKKIVHNVIVTLAFSYN